MIAAGRPASTARARDAHALIIERQRRGMWTATVIDPQTGAPLHRISIDDGPGLEPSGSDFYAFAESQAANLGPVEEVIILAAIESTSTAAEPRLAGGYPLPVWIVHPAVAIAHAVPPEHERFFVLDFCGAGAATMLKRGAGGEIKDLIKCDADLESYVSRRLDRNQTHGDILAEVAAASSPPQLDAAFAAVLRDLEPMFDILGAFGYDAAACVSSVFASEPATASFRRAAAQFGAGRRRSFFLRSGDERYQGAVNCVVAAKRTPGVWFAGSAESPSISLVTEHLVKYDVRHVAQHVFDLEDTTLGALLDGRKTLAVVDRVVDDNYGARLSAYATNHINLVGTLAVEATETAKSWTIVEQICDAAVRCGLGRDGIIMAVGGGITLDVAGMAASIFRRGIRYVRVPTTLVGMIDAGVGIKQGVNFASKKNILGTFYPPFGCVSDPSFLKTLPRRHIACGIAEMIKIALMCDSRLFEILESNTVEFITSHFRTPRALADESIIRAQLAMMRQLQPNLFEHDLQRWVDFGHTFSPTLELASHHKLAHGEAVALDMVLSTAIAVRRRICDIAVLERLVTLYRAAQLPTCDGLCSSDVLESSLSDVRLHRGGNLNFVVPTGIGAGMFLQDVDASDIEAAARIVADLKPAPTEA
jgi:3-dehydroquinate synthetase